MILLNQIVEKIKNSDRVIWFIIILLTLFSLMLIYSTTANLSNSSIYYLKKQIVFFVIGYFFMLSILFMNYRFFSYFGNILIWSSIGLLILAQVAGYSVNEATRWLEIPGIGFKFQPSELAKIAIVVYTAKVLSINQTIKGFNFKMFWKRLWPIGIIIFLVLIEDFSTAFLMGFTVFIMMFIGRTSLKIIGKIIASGSLVVLLLFFVAKTDIRPSYGRLTTVLNRIENFTNKSEVNEDKNLQIHKAKAAISTGGFFGKGPGNSDERYVLPLPYSDFIYAIVIEEFGALGGIFVLLLYLVLMFRAGIIVSKCNSTFPAFLVVGLTFIIVLQALINMSVAVNLIPVTGQPLPFVSMGGSSQIFTAASFGMILSISYTLNKLQIKKFEEEKV